MSKNKPVSFESKPVGSNDFFNIPLIGLVQANKDENNSGKYELHELVSNYPEHKKNGITLQALDNAMSEVGINKGDFINIDQNIKLKNGDIIVFQLNEKIFIRIYYIERNLIRLETSKNFNYPLVIDPKIPSKPSAGPYTIKK